MSLGSYEESKGKEVKGLTVFVTVNDHDFFDAENIPNIKNKIKLSNFDGEIELIQLNIENKDKR